MRSRFPLSAAAVLVAALLATPALAQDVGKMAMRGMNGGMGHTKLFTFGVGGGLAVPVSDAKDALKNGYNLLGYGRVQLPGAPVSFGVNVAFQRFDLKDATVSTGTGTATASGNSQMLAGLGDMKLDLMRGPLEPYLLVGLGAYNLKTDYSAAGIASSGSKTHFGINGGAGLAMHFGPVGGYVQARIDNVYTDTGGVIDTKTVQLIPVTLGLEF